MKKNYHHWTRKEDEILIREVSRHPENIKKSCSLAAEKIGCVTSCAAYYRYYKKLRHNNYIFSLIGKTILDNKKIIPNKRNKKKYNRIQLFVKKLFKI